MGWRFRRRIKIAPGFSLNLGKRGASLSMGGRGFTTNLSSKGLRSTSSIPGTGLSYTTSSGRRRSAKPRQAAKPPPAPPGTRSLGLIGILLLPVRLILWMLLLPFRLVLWILRVSSAARAQDPAAMKATVLALVLTAAIPAFAAAVLSAPAGERQIAASQSCCKVCRTGKACGNSCISAKRTCHKPRGCACNG